MEIKLFLSDYVDQVLSFEQERLKSKHSPLEVEFMTWDNPWRRESLQHYAQLGWSFAAIKDNEIQGYILSQPLLFFNNWTQSLWVEYLSSSSLEVGEELLNVTIQWAKSKHLQKVILNESLKNHPALELKLSVLKTGGYLHLSTTKMSEG